MATSAIEGVFVPGCLALAPGTINHGVTVFKKGYHGPRNWMRIHYPNDYSIIEPRDQQGPGDEGSAFDWTFPEARDRSDFRRIAKFSMLLYKAGKNKDPRTYGLREFFGNIDTDRTVEGWSFFRDREATSDVSHLWHMHFSWWRKYINDPAAMRAVLSILKGEDMPLSATDLEKIEAIVDAKIKANKNVLADALLNRDAVPNWVDPENNPNLKFGNSINLIGKQTK